ncbi:DUF2059 domain-containing protein [Rhodoferax aquaticus]|nr:DUF2059 domain-containing protein [Rhodoferax aquaticus]
MRLPATWILVATLWGLFAPVASADELSAEKRTDIEQLLVLTGALTLGQQMAHSMTEQMSQAIKAARPDIPQSLIDALPHEIDAVIAANLDSFKDATIPLYHRYYSGPEIKELLRFYASDLGKKTIAVMPQMMQESLAVGRAWGESLAPQIQARLRARFQKAGVSI